MYHHILPSQFRKKFHKRGCSKKADNVALKKSTIRINVLEKSPEKLIGIWADSVGGNAVFQIDKKTSFTPITTPAITINSSATAHRYIIMAITKVSPGNLKATIR